MSAPNYQLGDPLWRFHKEVAILLDTLPNEELKFVLIRRFGLDGAPPMTLKRVGSLLKSRRGGGKSPERVRQIEARALRVLRHPDRTVKVNELFFIDDPAVAELYMCVRRWALNWHPSQEVSRKEAKKLLEHRGKEKIRRAEWAEKRRQEEEKRREANRARWAAREREWVT
jgi:hypothetical protein